jgi:UDP-glucose 4-epimerase
LSLGERRELLSKKIYLVTGGAGYVGVDTVRRLVESRSATVHVLDNLVCGEHRLERLPRDEVVIHRCDIRDDASVSRVMSQLQPDVVIHLAAIHYIPACDAAPGLASSTNVAGTINLIAAVPRGTRFVFASTAAVYAPDDKAHDEDGSAIGPIDVYGLTKLHAEQFVRHFHSIGQIDGVIVRLFNVVGPGETNPHLVPAIIKQLASGDRRVRLGNLFPHRDYIDVRDASEGFIRLGDLPANGTEAAPITVNLGTGRSHAVGDVVKEIGRAASAELEVRQDLARIRAVDRPMLRASIANLRRLTGWQPSTSLSESLNRAWQERFTDGLG